MNFEGDPMTIGQKIANLRNSEGISQEQLAEKLAVTPMEKLHSRVAAKVARRILDTDPEFNPGTKVTGHWNFFCRTYIRKKSDSLILTDYTDETVSMKVVRIVQGYVNVVNKFVWRKY